MITIIVFAPADDAAHTSPRGFTFADQVFAEAGYRDPVSKSQQGAAKLQRTLSYLIRRYPGRLRVNWVNPWSLQGLIFSMRYRLRQFPAAVIQRKNQRQVLMGDELEQIGDHVANWLSQPEDD